MKLLGIFDGKITHNSMGQFKSLLLPRGIWQTLYNTSSVVFFGAFVAPVQLQSHTRIFKNRSKACRGTRKRMGLHF